ncbi:hypothetical protein AB0N59_00330 [Microbacterium sp. NPDC089321]|uniref:hypothetical protein n=1 Tax=Microbacterium sp. NPDC089321 TaxID=3155183 RepID=UPI00342058AA
MLDEAKSSRRRELQRRAYAAGGALTEAEHAELRELDALTAHSAPAVPPSVPAPERGEERPDQHGPPDSAARSERPSPRPAGSEADETPAHDGVHRKHASEAADADATSGRRRPGIPILVLSTLVALLVGFGGGWVLLSRSDAPAMNAAQASALAEIEKTGRFDPGSIVYLGEKYDASVWRATSEDGAKTCLAISVADQNRFECMVPPEPDGEAPFAQPIGVSIDHAEGEHHWSYWATLIDDVAGRETLLVQRHDMSAGMDWTSQFTDEERAQIEKIAEQGVDSRYIQIVGYDGEVPVFISQEMKTCVYVVDPEGGAVIESCEPTDEGVFLLSRGSTVYEVRETPSRGPVLTVVRNGG